MAKYQGRSIYIGQRPGAYSAEVLQQCSECGALVTSGMTEIHSEYHDKVNELADKVWRAGLE